MDRWRAFFAKAGGDIWTVIDKAIVLAATDFPNEFKDKRSDIAETLFARNLLHLHSATRLSGSIVTNLTNQIVENDVRNDEEQSDHPRAVSYLEQERNHHRCDDTEALADERKEETMLLKEIYRIKETITAGDQPETILVDSLQKLEYLQVTVESLKATELGKHVNGLRKHPSNRVRALVKRLVRGWKDLVDEWVKTAGDTAVAAIADSSEGGPVETHTKDDGLVERISLEMSHSQVFSLSDDIQGSSQAVNLYPGDSLYPSSKLQSGVIQTDYRKCDIEASVSNDNVGIRLPEERGSTNRVAYGGLNKWELNLETDSRNSANQTAIDQKEGNENLRFLTGNNATSSSCPGRPANQMSRVKASGAVGASGSGRLVKSYDKQRSGVGMVLNQPERNGKPSTQKSSYGDDLHVARKLELSKKFPDVYQQAENAKKQRTVQLMDLPDFPLGGPNQGKPNFSSQSKPDFQNCHWHQNRK